ncbi:DUF2231 domain-containing protein [Sphingomonas aestuarii]|jgi:uncharacterized membrane protein
MSERVVIFGAALAFLMLAAPIAAHENHEALGAGPGPVTQQGLATTVPAEAVGIHDNMTAAHGAAMDDHAAANGSFGQRLISWLGRMHSLLVHFPIAMFLGAVGVELFGLWKGRRDYRRIAHVMLIVGAVGAVAAASLGWFAGGLYLSDRNPILTAHRWLGTAIAIVGLVLLYLSITAQRATDAPRRLYWILLGVMTFAIAIQGWLGGTFMHGGINHLAF